VTQRPLNGTRRGQAQRRGALSNLSCDQIFSLLGVNVSDSAKQVRAANAYVRALRSGEGSASSRAEPYLAPEVVATIGNAEFSGKEAVLAHITGIWPNTPVYQLGAWDDPSVDGDVVTIDAEFPAFGAGASKATLTFSFNADDQIVSVSESYASGPRPEPQKEMPLIVRGMINSALANGTPIVVAYTGEDGSPQLSLRGSTLAYSPTQLAIWLRSAEGGLNRALATNPQLSLLYRDSRTRSTLIVKGTGRIEDDPAIRDEIFELTPEVEQMHDPGRNGAALIIDVTSVRGGTPRGGVNVQI
jgi:hypothetical protein